MKIIAIVSLLAMVFTMTGCQLSLVSNVETESRNGMTIQHTIYFDSVEDIESDTINGFKFASKGVGGHYDYGWVLCIEPAVADIDDLQEKVRQFTEANMTHRWVEERNSNVDGVVTMQGHYEGIDPNMQGFASLDSVADKYNTQIYAVSENGYTKVLILAVNNTDTQLIRDETALMQGTLSKTENFEDSINNNSADGKANGTSSAGDGDTSSAGETSEESNEESVTSSSSEVNSEKSEEKSDDNNKVSLEDLVG